MFETIILMFIISSFYFGFLARALKQLKDAERTHFSQLHSDHDLLYKKISDKSLRLHIIDLKRDTSIVYRDSTPEDVGYNIMHYDTLGIKYKYIAVNNSGDAYIITGIK